ncbi:hypothetical protein Mgra_00008076 [Meloidogyne graminicola]|uniref:Uncharacterized protein n=1 Tax=Meloidogyne graminicola TaxID=189291 RepID=A0A8S9ZGN1_9BILA|nr:hypothetical protein Mgra_00008076 [Meloidogyne graminicola]
MNELNFILILIMFQMILIFGMERGEGSSSQEFDFYQLVPPSLNSNNIHQNISPSPEALNNELTLHTELEKHRINSDQIRENINKLIVRLKNKYTDKIIKWLNKENDINTHISIQNNISIYFNDNYIQLLNKLKEYRSALANNEIDQIKIIKKLRTNYLNELLNHTRPQQPRISAQTSGQTSILNRNQEQIGNQTTNDELLALGLPIGSYQHYSGNQQSFTDLLSSGNLPYEYFGHSAPGEQSNPQSESRKLRKSLTFKLLDTHSDQSNKRHDGGNDGHDGDDMNINKK